MASGKVHDRASILQAEVAALNELLAVQKRAMADQAMKLDRALREARLAQQRWQSVFTASPVGLLLLDENTVIVFVNNAVAKLAGKNCAEMVSRQPGDALGCIHALEHPGGCGKGPSCASCLIRARIEEALKTGQAAYGLEVQPVIVVRGVQIKPWLEISVEPVAIAGRPHLVLSIADITRRKQAEEALRASEQRYAAVVDNIGIGVALISPKMEILSLNRQMREWFPEIEPSVKPICYKAFNRPPRDAACGYCPTGLTLRDGQNHESVTETPAEDRTINFRIISSAIRDEKGEVVAAIEMVEDVTSSKQAQERLKRYAVDLARANEEVKQFAYIVSHDCRAPLVNIKGFIGEIRICLAAAQKALAPALPHLSEEQAQAATKALETDLPEALKFMDAAATGMDRLIEALLKLSRLERQELHPERLRVAEVVANALKGLAHQISERGATVRVGELPEVIADRTAMEQIMGNLLSNAVLYLDPSRPGRIEVGGSRSGEETTFFVRDNGRGISPEDIPKLFAPFRRAGKQDVKGEGMGLAYVRTLVRRHEGEIHCESQLGVGTTFTFTLRNSIKKGEHDAHDPAEGV